jgi:copper(I)-binding protein
MKRTITAICLSTTLLIGAMGAGLAEVVTHGPLTITAPWAKATPAGARVAGGYLAIRNNGTTPDRLIGGAFAAAKRVEVHEMSIVNDVMHMRELPDGLTIKPGSEVVLKPGAFHLMFMGLKHQLKPGDIVKGTLDFAKAGRVNVTFEVRTLAGKRVHHGMKHRNHTKHGGKPK